MFNLSFADFFEQVFTDAPERSERAGEEDSSNLLSTEADTSQDSVKGYEKLTRFRLGVFDEPYGKTGFDWDQPLKGADVKSLFNSVKKYMQKDGTFVYFTPWDRIGKIAQYAEQEDLEVRGLYVWVKKVPKRPAEPYYGSGESGREFFLLIGHSDARPVWNEMKQPAQTVPHPKRVPGCGVVYFHSPAKARGAHAAAKPPALMQWLIHWYVSCPIMIRRPFL